MGKQPARVVPHRHRREVGHPFVDQSGGEQRTVERGAGLDVQFVDAALRQQREQRSQVDAAIGGKTAIDLPQGKNLVGAFYQPRAVFIDRTFLLTLDERNLRAGMAEVVKCALAGDAALWSLLADQGGRWKAMADRDWGAVVRSAVAFKAWVVERDEKEASTRRILNLGHTVGHALERAAGLLLVNGGVLALVSKPGFDPNLFIDGIDPETWKALNESPERPMVNRVLRGVYPPGSTIKPFMALAGLELGVRKPGDTIVDPGYFTLPNSSHQFRDWKKGGHGLVDMERAIAQSCDTYFYKLAVDLGIDRMHDYLEKFSFGEKTGIDLEGESPGLLPSRDWKQRRWKKEWYPGETVIAGIGQGYHLTTPLQLATATAMLANGGKRIEPRLVQAVRDPLTHVWQPQPVVVRDQVAIKPEDLAVIRQGMMDVMRPGGTASAAAAGATYTIAGKTGTAQVVGIKQGARYNAGQLSRQNRDHALFIAYAPVENPKIAIAVMVENGGHGGSTAAPIARAVMDYYLAGKRPGNMNLEGSDASD